MPDIMCMPTHLWSRLTSSAHATGLALCIHVAGSKHYLCIQTLATSLLHHMLHSLQGGLVILGHQDHRGHLGHPLGPVDLGVV